MPSFKQIAIPGKGQGLVATKAIKRGTRILSERPLLSVAGNAAAIVPILHAFSALDVADMQAYCSLHRYLHPSVAEKIAHRIGKPVASLDPRIFAFVATFVTNHLGDHVFLQGSRINHSCVPNVEFAWNPDSGHGTFHAIKEIKQGEELTLSYIRGANWTKVKRGRALQPWGFTCSCYSCQDTVDAKVDDEFRAKRCMKIASLAQAQEQDGTTADYTRKSRDTCNAAAAGLLAQGTPTREVSAWYNKAAKFAWRSGTLHASLHYLALALTHEKLCLGNDHPNLLRCQDILARLRAASEDQSAYEAVQRARPAEEFEKLAQATDRYNAASAGRIKKPEKDWRLLNQEKALWWAEVEWRREEREHVDKEHVATVRKRVDVEFLRERLGDGGVEPYRELCMWAERLVV